MTRNSQKRGRGPGLIYILAALVIVGVAGAKFFGFTPGLPGTQGEQSGDSMPKPAPGEDNSSTPTPGRSTLGNARVLVYHSHTTENYHDKKSHEEKGPGDVVAVGKVLVDSLRDQGIDAVHVMTVHDLPEWHQSENKARASVEDILERNEDIEVIVDIHRDAIPPGEQPGYAQLVNGEETLARMLFIVGTINNPIAQANVRYAEQLRDKLESEMPGITRGVRLMQQNTNGDLRERSVTVFIGDYTDNTLEHAEASAILLGRVIAGSLN